MELVEDDEVRADFFNRAIVHEHQLRVGEEADVLGDGGHHLFQVFELGFEDVFRGRKPADGFVRVVLAELEADERFPGTRGVNDGGLAGFGKHGDGGGIGRLVMRI